MTRAAHAALADPLRPSVPGAEAAWAAEINRRVAAIEAGTENLERSEEVRRRMERKIRNR